MSQDKCYLPQGANNEEVTLPITGLTHSAEGVGRLNGLAVFVPGAVPGDTVLARLEERKKSYARARLLEVLQEAPERRPAPCPHFSGCGGCRLQQVTYAEQLRLKKQLVQDSLARLGGLGDVPVHDVAGMDNPWHYRNKITLHAGWSGGRYVLGLFTEGSHDLIELYPLGVAEPAAGCLLVNKELNQVARTVQELLNKYAPTGTNDFFHRVILRKAVATGQIMVVLVTAGGAWAGESALVRDLLSRHPAVSSLLRHVPAPGFASGGGSYKLLAGKEYIEEELLGLYFRISPAAFFQVNPVQTAYLYQKALQYAALTGRETALDAYCGTGTIALLLARQAARVYGLEVVAQAVVDARQNALRNNTGNVRFMEGAVEKLLPRLAARGLRPHLIVLDPPRSGCGRPALQAVAAMQVPRLVYVSCDPGTLARDLAFLSQYAYRALEVQPVDMFPWTSHVECVVSLKRKHSP
ncbi:23S rRNA (uracil(1939)-C(5))-methyltransferase RlmD [Desulfurispora thermophila]|uniref:23S rRNA (uracil(1939)-C(5))-methyltransferase RlmD n=1 Tax=Desulfurispora thermophila TaxID=265470 RepID=UPI0006884662|nr:23S rRNA (uracil(1939)-C(5))-methyltransferase RlmD [Desulfurispora thermophila]